MSELKIQFKPGQIWRKRGTGEQWKLSRVENSFIYGIDYRGKEGPFARVDSKGNGILDAYYWMEVVPRECKCGTNREVCTYHKALPHQVVEN